MISARERESGGKVKRDAMSCSDHFQPAAREGFVASADTFTDRQTIKQGVKKKRR